MCTCISTCIHVCLTPHVCLTHLDSYMKTCMSLCGSVCVPVTLLVFPHLDWNVYMHQYMYTCPPDLPWCASSHLNSYIETWVPLCDNVYVSQSPACGPKPWLKCLYVSVHVFMSTQLPMLAQPPMNSYLETWVIMCVTVCVSQSPCFWCHTYIKVCTCISTWIHVHLAPHVYSTPFA